MVFIAPGVNSALIHHICDGPAYVGRAELPTEAADDLGSSTTPFGGHIRDPNGTLVNRQISRFRNRAIVNPSF